MIYEALDISGEEQDFPLTDILSKSKSLQDFFEKINSELIEKYCDIHLLKLEEIALVECDIFMTSLYWLKKEFNRDTFTDENIVIDRYHYLEHLIEVFALYYIGKKKETFPWNLPEAFFNITFDDVWDVTKIYCTSSFHIEKMPWKYDVIKPEDVIFEPKTWNFTQRIDQICKKMCTSRMKREFIKKNESKKV